MPPKADQFVPKMDDKSLRSLLRSGKRKYGTQFVPKMDDKSLRSFHNIAKRKYGTQKQDSSTPSNLKVVDGDQGESSTTKPLKKTPNDQAGEVNPSDANTETPLKNELEEKPQKVKELSDQVSGMKKLEERIKVLISEKEKLQQQLGAAEQSKVVLSKDKEELSANLKKAKEAFADEKIKWEKEMYELKMEIAYQHGRGFEKAIEQVKFLCPEVNLEELGLFKIVQDGKLVDPDED
ncbi:hypothetical protein SESBI_48301 [Sesbania bispinosa]|nr:hypothetical protein SESBI_48301 [Sesbania bispinosa]